MNIAGVQTHKERVFKSTHRKLLSHQTTREADGGIGVCVCVYMFYWWQHIEATWWARECSHTD